MATAIPREINLGLQKPSATPAYTRRFKSQANTTTTAAGSQVTITLDTAQPGSFIDCLSSYLSFTLNFTNNTTQGYNVSFSAAGAHSLIRALRIYVQGVPIEEITEYNALVEFLMDLSGCPDYSDMSAKSRFLSNTMFSDQTIYLPPASVSDPIVKSMNIQLPLLSGVLGTMAEKMFPSMLVAPGNCYIQLDLATASNAFKIQHVDVSSLVVSDGLSNMIGTSATLATGSIPVLSNIITSAVSAVGRSSGADGVTLHVPAGFVCTAGRNSKLESDSVYDTVITDPTNLTNQYVYSTEERIGGGIWGGVGTPVTIAAAVVPTGVDGTLPVAYGDVLVPNAPLRLGTGVAVTGNGTASSTNITKMLAAVPVSYTITGVEFIGKQVVVGDDVARAIIERSAAGDISIHTQSYRQYPQTISASNWTYQENPLYLSKNGTGLGLPIIQGSPLVNGLQRFCRIGAQSIIIPAKISSANAIYNLFRNGSGLDDFRFDSLRRMTIGMTDDNTSACTVQMRIGNELIPQSPIQSASEALQELLKAHHIEGYMGTCEKMGSIVANSQCFTMPATTTPLYYSLTNARYSADVHGIESLVNPQGQFNDPLTFKTGGLSYQLNDYNSNILYTNPDAVTFNYPSFSTYAIAGGGVGNLTAGTAPSALFTTLLNAAAASKWYTTVSTASQSYCTMTGAAVGITSESGWDYITRQAKFKEAVRRAFFGGRYSSGRDGVKTQDLSDPKSANFVSPYKQHAGKYSTFALGFDLDTFSHNTDTIRSGHYLGNNTVSLNISNIVVEDNSPLNMPLMNSLRMDSYILHDLRLSFQAGGIVQAFY